MPPVTYNPAVTALLNSEATIQLQQADLFSRPLDGLEEGRHYSLAEALPLLPAGPVKNAALLFANASDVSFSYKLAGAGGGSPQFSFLQEPQAGVPYKKGTFLSGPNDNPAPGDSFSVNVGGVVILVGGFKAMDAAGVPKPLIGPAMGTTFALADEASTVFFKTDPAAPLTVSLRNNLASLGVMTGTQVGFSYGLDAIGVPMGTEGNTWGSLGFSALSLLPAIESPMNPFYSTTFSNAFRSATGVGLVGGAEGSTIFLADGAAGGAGLSGAGMQSLGAAGAVWMGGSLGGWTTRQATGMNDANDPKGQLSRLVYERFKSEAWDGVGSTPLGDIMAGMLSLNEMGDGEAQLSQGLRWAQNDLVSETSLWAGTQMDTLLISAMMANSNQQGEPMNYEGFEKSLRTFYQQNSNAIYAQDGVLQTLRENGLISESDLGITRFVDNNGFVTNRERLKSYAADLMENHLKLRTEALENEMKRVRLAVGDDGNLKSVYGGAFTEEQLQFMRFTRATLAGGIMRITNALAALRPEAVAAN